MREQIMPIGTSYLSFPASEQARKTVAASYPDAEFWMRVYPPMSRARIHALDFRSVCPWSMAAELNDDVIVPSRRKNILESLKTGLKTIRQYDLPACRIQFMEHRSTREISVWVD